MPVIHSLFRLRFVFYLTLEQKVNKYVEQIRNTACRCKEMEKIMKQVLMDVTSGMVLAGFVTMMTVWMMVISG